MKRILLGITLLAIIFIAILCKPVETSDKLPEVPEQEARAIME